MDALPIEIWWQIASFLDSLSSIYRFLSTCSYASRLLDSEPFWGDIGQTLFRSLYLNIFDQDVEVAGWKQAAYRALIRSQNPCIMSIRDRPPQSADDTYTHLLKFVMVLASFLQNLLTLLSQVGDPAVGKSCITLRYFSTPFCGPAPTTIGVDFKTKVLYRFEPSSLGVPKIQCWDTAGQERFMTITRAYYRGAAVLLLVFDVTRPNTLENAIERWRRDIVRAFATSSNAPPGARAPTADQLNVFLVGNKIDLLDERQVSREEGMAAASEFGWGYYETSAKSDDGITDLFECVTRITLEKFHLIKDSRWFAEEQKRREEELGARLAAERASQGGWCW